MEDFEVFLLVWVEVFWWFFADAGELFEAVVVAQYGGMEEEAAI